MERGRERWREVVIRERAAAQWVRPVSPLSPRLALLHCTTPPPRPNPNRVTPRLSSRARPQRHAGTGPGRDNTHCLCWTPVSLPSLSHTLTRLFVTYWVRGPGETRLAVHAEPPSISSRSRVPHPSLSRLSHVSPTYTHTHSYTFTRIPPGVGPVRDTRLARPVGGDQSSR